MIVCQLLSCKGGTEIDVTLANQRDGKLAHSRVDPIVRSPVACLVTDPGRAFGLKILQQSVNLSST